jgi:hypothetical protein
MLLRMQYGDDLNTFAYFETLEVMLTYADVC